MARKLLLQYPGWKESDLAKWRKGGPGEDSPSAAFAPENAHAAHQYPRPAGDGLPIIACVYAPFAPSRGHSPVRVGGREAVTGHFKTSQSGSNQNRPL